MKVRLEYEVAQRLVWDAGFRREFMAGPAKALKTHFPGLRGLERFGAQQFAGIQDEAFRRIADVSRVAQTVFPRGCRLLEANGGERFFDELLRRFLRPDTSAGEVFSVQNVGPRVLETAALPQFAEALSETLPVLDYEWARLCARQAIEEHWDPADSAGALVAGAALVFAPFDLLALLDEVDRIERSNAPNWVFARRARPGPGHFRRVIFPSGRKIVEADVDVSLFGVLTAAIHDPATPRSSFGSAYQRLRGAGVLKELSQ